MNRFFTLRVLVLGFLAVQGLSAVGARAGQGAAPSANTPIEHLVVLMQDNHTFDNYFGTYPGADGLPSDTCMPVDPLAEQSSCIEPFHIGEPRLSNLDRGFSTYRGQFDNQYRDGHMDGFVHALRLRNLDGAFVMGYYDDRDLAYYWNIADRYVLFDHFFSSSNEGSLPNHMFSIAAISGGGRNRPPSEGYQQATIFDRLQERGISWKYYVKGYNPGITYRNAYDPEQRRSAAQTVRVPLLNFPRFLDDPERSSRIVDLREYYKDLVGGTLPAVSFIASAGATEHPPGSLEAGQRFVRSLLNPLVQSSAWDHTAFLLTYDEWGGWYDHVRPPQVDEHGYGFRVPALLVSPYARKGVVDHTTLDFTSVLRFIEDNYDLEPLASRDREASSIINAFDFDQAGTRRAIIPWNESPPERRGGPPPLLLYSLYGGTIGFAVVFIALAFLSGRPRRKGAEHTWGSPRK